MSTIDLCPACKEEYLFPGEVTCFKCSKAMIEFKFTLWARRITAQRRKDKFSYRIRE